MALSALCTGAYAQVETVRVRPESLERKVPLTGEFLPYQSVELTAKVNGYVERIEVDRGSRVRRGQLLITLTAPEMAAQMAEAESKVKIIESQRAEAEARLASAASTYDRLKSASATAGAIAGNELIVAEKQVEAAKAQVASYESSARAAAAAADAVGAMQAYLRISAPFDGVVTERMVHPGALAAAGRDPLLRIEQVSRLRLVVAVPEAEVGGIVRGARVPFHVPAFPGETFVGVVRRLSASLDAKTRTMPVELDVPNPGGRLAPGMYPEVIWPVRRSKPSLLVPAASIVTTTERTFVIRVRGGRAEWVNVRRGVASGDMVEVLGDLQAGDVIVRRATDEIRDGSALRTK